MFIIQRCLYTTLYYIYANLLGTRTFRRVGDSCARKRVEYMVKQRSTVIRVKHCFKNG